LRARTREEALREIVATMQGDGKVMEPDKLLAQVIAREEAHSTFMGRGVAFPHARSTLVTQIVLGIGRSRDGVPFGGGGELAHLLFVIAVPQQMVTDYLVCVGALARLVRDDETRAALDEATTPAEFVERLRVGSLLLE
nr:PTS sugar transporter subunit IIA [Chthoniobacterales bacterium]